LTLAWLHLAAGLAGLSVAAIKRREYGRYFLHLGASQPYQKPILVHPKYDSQLVPGPSLTNQNLCFDFKKRNLIEGPVHNRPPLTHPRKDNSVEVRPYQLKIRYGQLK